MKRNDLLLKETDEIIDLLDILLNSIDNENDYVYDKTLSVIKNKQEFIKNLDSTDNPFRELSYYGR